jgi:hypothetical protein
MGILVVPAIVPRGITLGGLIEEDIPPKRLARFVDPGLRVKTVEFDFNVVIA